MESTSESDNEWGQLPPPPAPPPSPSHTKGPETERMATNSSKKETTRSETSEAAQVWESTHSLVSNSLDPNCNLPEACLFVASLSTSISEQELQQHVTAHFAKWGKLTNVKVLKDWLARPYAFVQYESPQDAHAALLRAHNTLVCGRYVRVEQAKVNRTLFLGKLGRLEDNEVMEMIQEFGAVEELTLLRDFKTGRTKGCGFVKFRFRDSAIAAFLGMRQKCQWTIEWATNLDRTKPEIDLKSIFVGQLNQNIITDRLLHTRFEQYGEIKSCQLVNKNFAGPDSKPAFAFISFADDASAEQAIENENGKLWLDRTLRVQYREIGEYKGLSRNMKQELGITTPTRGPPQSKYHQPGNTSSKYPRPLTPTQPQQYPNLPAKPPQTPQVSNVATFTPSTTPVSRAHERDWVKPMPCPPRSNSSFAFPHTITQHQFVAQGYYIPPQAGPRTSPSTPFPLHQQHQQQNPLSMETQQVPHHPPYFPYNPYNLNPSNLQYTTTSSSHSYSHIGGGSGGGATFPSMPAYFYEQQQQQQSHNSETSVAVQPMNTEPPSIVYYSSDPTVPPVQVPFSAYAAMATHQMEPPPPTTMHMVAPHQEQQKEAPLSEQDPFAVTQHQFHRRVSSSDAESLAAFGRARKFPGPGGLKRFWVRKSSGEWVVSGVGSRIAANVGCGLEDVGEEIEVMSV